MGGRVYAVRDPARGRDIEPFLRGSLLLQSEFREQAFPPPKDGRDSQGAARLAKAQRHVMRTRIDILQQAVARLECLSLQHEEVLDNRAERQHGEILQEIDD